MATEVSALNQLQIWQNQINNGRELNLNDIDVEGTIALKSTEKTQLLALQIFSFFGAGFSGLLYDSYPSPLFVGTGLISLCGLLTAYTNLGIIEMQEHALRSVDALIQEKSNPTGRLADIQEQARYAIESAISSLVPVNEVTGEGYPTRIVEYTYLKHPHTQ